MATKKEKIIDPIEHALPIEPVETEETTETEEDAAANPENPEAEEATIDEEDLNPFGDKWET